MGEAFLKLKRRFMVAAILKSAVIGASVGIFAVGAVLLALKLSAITVNAGYYALIGVGLALLVGVGLFLIFKPTDRKVAKRLDGEYALAERVQTALAYQGVEGGVHELQRDDTAKVLSELKLKKPTIKQLWQYIVVAVLAVALAVVAIALPPLVAQGEETPPSGPTWSELPFEVSAYQIARVESLIEDVEQSYLADSIKLDLTAALELLIDDLYAAENNGDMQYAVTTAIRTVDNACKTESSYYNIGTSLKNMGRTELAKVIAEGAEVYSGYTLVAGVDVRTFYNGRADAVDSAISSELETVKNLIIDAFTSEEGNINQILGSISAALIGASVDKDDALYAAINTLTLGLIDLLPSDVDGDSIDSAVASDDVVLEPQLTPEQQALVDDINALFAVFGYSVADELAEQAYVFAFDKYIANVLIDRFDLNTALASSVGWNLRGQLNTDSDQNDKEPDKPNEGGYGEGNVEYGSDDLIYDPATGQYVPYGEIINEYYRIVNSLLNEGALTEEQASIVRAYFEMLISGFKD